jgi:hypothetical protein
MRGVVLLKFVKNLIVGFFGRDQISALAFGICVDELACFY